MLTLRLLLVADRIARTLSGGVIIPNTCPSECCQRAGDEAYYACMEYEIMTAELNCDAWRAKAVEVCTAQCSDCRAISRALRVMCERMLRNKLGSAQIAAQCDLTKLTYETLRCSSVCQLSYLDCATEEAMNCRYCGNWQECHCYLPFGDDVDRCAGEVFLPGAQHRCSRMPVDCMSHHADAPCGRYKWCQRDLCVLKNIVCPLTNVCHRTTTCVPASGECAPSHYSDGYPCDTGLPYVLPDSGACINGHCVGKTNYCCKHRVKCETSNPCVLPFCNFLTRQCSCSSCKSGDNSSLSCDPLCDPMSGICEFETRADGASCTTHRPWIRAESCWKGMCVGAEVDLCSVRAVACDAPPQCRGPGECDPKTGECYYPPLDNSACDDNSAQTHHDVCVEGFCRSSFFDAPHYLLVGKGACADSSKRTVNTLVKQNIAHADCETECSRDVACEAYTWAIFVHTCTLYTRLRDAPRTGWELHRSPFHIVNVISSVIPFRSGEPIVTCYRKVSTVEPMPGRLSATARFWFLLSAIVLFSIGIFAYGRRKTIREIWEFLDSDLDVSAYSNVQSKSTGGFASRIDFFRRNRKTGVLDAPKMAELEETVVEDVSDTDYDMMRPSFAPEMESHEIPHTFDKLDTVHDSPDQPASGDAHDMAVEDCA